MSLTLFDDLFKVVSIDTGRYDRVARLIGQSTSTADVQVTLDVNSELFPVSEGDTLTVSIAQSLSLSGSAPDEGATSKRSWREPKPGERTMADDYDYVMYGTVYKFEESSGDKIAVYISFGGLLMCLEGSYRKLSNLKQENIYLLMRK